MGLARSGSAQRPSARSMREEEAMRGHRRRRATKISPRNPHAAGPLRGPRSLWVSPRRGHLQRWRSSTMTPHRLRRAALHLTPPSQKRGTS
jgi:hypothetical protein